MLSPILIFSYKRVGHLRKLITSLLTNELASKSNLIIFSDGPKSLDDADSVNECRKYIETISGFNSIKIISRDKNLGLANSLIAGVNEALNEFDRAIILEDDLVVSSNFLQFMNDALRIYEHCDDVISIHGYVYPVSEQLPTSFFLRGADCWGWATWRRGWSLFNPNGISLLSEIQRRGLARSFNFNNSYDFLGMLTDQINGKNDSWAIRWYASAFLKNKLTLYPGNSLVANYGNDGFGSHQGNTKLYDVDISANPIFLESTPIVHSLVAAEIFEKYFRNSKSRGIISRLAKKILGYYYV
jgi:hypothetical protein